MLQVSTIDRLMLLKLAHQLEREDVPVHNNRTIGQSTAERVRMTVELTPSERDTAIEALRRIGAPTSSDLRSLKRTMALGMMSTFGMSPTSAARETLAQLHSEGYPWLPVQRGPKPTPAMVRALAGEISRRKSLL